MKHKPKDAIFNFERHPGVRPIPKHVTSFANEESNACKMKESLHRAELFVVCSDRKDLLVPRPVAAV